MVDPTTDCEFLGQLLQAATPVSAEYVLALQSVQSALPEFALYFPAPHAAHGSPSRPLKPASHTQAVCMSLPVAACELAKQGWQVPISVAPVAVEYVLTPQSRHTDPNDVYLPAVHFVQVLATAAEIVPAAQLLQELAPLRLGQ